MDIIEPSTKYAELLNDKGLFFLRFIINIRTGEIKLIPRKLSTLACALGILNIDESLLKRKPEIIENLIEAVALIENRNILEISVGFGSINNVIKFKYPKKSLDVAYDILINYLKKNGYFILRKAA